jgi:uncharacterized membrane protein
MNRETLALVIRAKRMATSPVFWGGLVVASAMQVHMQYQKALEHQPKAVKVVQRSDNPIVDSVQKLFAQVATDLNLKQESKLIDTPIDTTEFRYQQVPQPKQMF